MTSLTFEWQRTKNLLNQKKSGISFEEAQTVFFDDNASLMHDPDHSGEEDRFILLGLSAKLRVLIVCHYYRKNDDVIRIISARKAIPTEQNQYWRR